MIVKVDCDREVTWDEVIRKARVPKGNVSTAAKRMKQAFGIKRRILASNRPDRPAGAARCARTAEDEGEIQNRMATFIPSAPA